MDALTTAATLAARAADLYIKYGAAFSTIIG